MPSKTPSSSSKPSQIDPISVLSIQVSASFRLCLCCCSCFSSYYSSSCCCCCCCCCFLCLVPMIQPLNCLLLDVYCFTIWWSLPTTCIWGLRGLKGAMILACWHGRWPWRLQNIHRAVIWFWSPMMWLSKLAPLVFARTFAFRFSPLGFHKASLRLHCFTASPHIHHIGLRKSANETMTSHVSDTNLLRIWTAWQNTCVLYCFTANCRVGWRVSNQTPCWKDQFFQKASEFARIHGLPRVYVSCNSGARVGLVEELKPLFKVKWFLGWWVVSDYFSLLLVHRLLILVWWYDTHIQYDSRSYDMILKNNMIWFGMICYQMIFDMTWFDMIWCDMI